VVDNRLRKINVAYPQALEKELEIELVPKLRYRKQFLLKKSQQMSLQSTFKFKIYFIVLFSKYFAFRNIFCDQ